MRKIDKIINEMYKEFSGNKPGEYLDACTVCCMSKGNAAKLKVYPIHEIPLELLKEYQDAAKPEKLNFSELKYFAPRYLELVKEFKFPSFEPLLSLDRFGYFNYNEWTKKERELLDEYSIELFNIFIESCSEDDMPTPIEILLMFQKGNFAVDNLLTYLEKSSSQNALVFFSKIIDGLKITKRGIVQVKDAFADEEFSNKICQWVDSEHVKDNFRFRIEQELMNPTGVFTDIELEELSSKYELLI